MPPLFSKAGWAGAEGGALGKVVGVAVAIGTGFAVGLLPAQALIARAPSRALRFGEGAARDMAAQA
jgi:hypothetical protein